ncbi:MAG: hypothetical protein J5738_07980 [Lachnospiraceae bacterium]|nr:hypothetical protein [Lachnospiraceae bacterium]
MNLTLMQLFLIITLAVSTIIPTLYSIVITILFVSEKREYMYLAKQYEKLESHADKFLLERKKAEKEDNDKKTMIKAGFAVTEEAKQEKSA